MRSSIPILAAAAVVAAAAPLAPRAARATPSTAFWTPATAYLQPFAVPHVTYDTYFGEDGAYGIDTGLTMGLIPLDVFQLEFGLDFFYPNDTKAAVQINGKLGIPDGAFGRWSPGITTGVWGIGFEEGVSDYHVWHAEVGKSFVINGIPLGTLAAGAYWGLGSDAVWAGSDGTVRRVGFIGSYTSPDIPIGLTGLEKISFVGDVQTGRNAVGGGGAGIGVFFTPIVSVLTGPVFFFDRDKQPGGSLFLWSVQLDVDLDFRSRPAPAPVARTGVR
ncbi:MAG: hypothetical protein FJ087_13280 [Deltaproteobacteria bacterium]|nr:hypothetical protein [Deltaproteobacteria bacterium]